MFHRVAELFMAILFLFALYTTVIASTEQERNQQPDPAPTPRIGLETFDVGVTKVFSTKGLLIEYTNTVEKGVVTTKGRLVFDKHDKLKILRLKYLIADKDLNPIIIVFLIDVMDPERTTEFEVTYPFHGAYEYTLFFIDLIVPEPVIPKGEKTINV